MVLALTTLGIWLTENQNQVDYVYCGRMWSRTALCDLWCAHDVSASSQYTSLTHALRPRQNGCHFAEDPFKHMNETLRISIEFSLIFVPKGPINNIPALFQIMAMVLTRRQPIV